jgi:hypothetical protein
MKQITLSVPDNKYSFFLELIKSLGFVKGMDLDPDPTKAEILDGISEAVNEVKLHKKGKVKLKTAQQFLNEL